MNSETLIPSEQVVCVDLSGGEGVLVDLNSKKYFQLNETAMLVWRSLEQKRAPEEIVGELTKAYDVTPEHAAESVARLLREFKSRKIVRPS